jgi:hypothetical protein
MSIAILLFLSAVAVEVDDQQVVGLQCHQLFHIYLESGHQFGVFILLILSVNVFTEV